MTGRDAMLSDDPPPSAGDNHEKKSGFSLRDFSFAALGEALKAAPGELNEWFTTTVSSFSSFAFGVLTANTDSPDDKLSEFNGWKALATARQNGSTHQQAGDSNCRQQAAG
jgi:hypothetical protein